MLVVYSVMSAEYRIDKKSRLVLSTGSGVFTMADALAAHQDKLLHDPDFAPDFCQLWDLSLVTEAQLTSDDLRRLARRSVFSPDSRRAVLVSSDLAFGLSRMFVIFRQMLGETGIRVFRDRGEALDWVLAKNTID
jgi:hypothetical protein